MPRRKERNELVAGGFIAASIVLAVVVLLVLADWRSLLEPSKSVRVIFSGQSVKGLDKGATVRFNGVPIGQVRKVTLEYEHPDRIEAILAVPRDLRLYANASLYIGTGALGGNAWIEVEDTGLEAGCRVRGDPPDRFRRLPGPSGPPATQPEFIVVPNIPLADADNPIYGNERPNALVTDMGKTMGWGAEQQTRLQATMRAINDAANAVNDILGGIRDQAMPKVNTSLTNIQTITDTGTSLINALNTKAPGVLERIDDTVTDVHNLLEKQGPVLAETIQRLNSMSGTLDQGSKQQLQNVQAAMTQLNDALAKARESMDYIRQFTGAARDILVSQRDSLNDTLANFKEGSDHFSAALAEVRREPWRLLYRPKPDELTASNVVEAARAFEEGASAVREASTRLKALLELRGGQVAPDDAQYLKLREDLQRSTEKFDKAEKALYEALRVTSRPRPVLPATRNED